MVFKQLIIDFGSTHTFIELVKKDMEEIGQEFDEEFIFSETKIYFKAHIKTRPGDLVMPDYSYGFY